MNLTGDDWSALTGLRQEIHSHPELSGQESKTPERILDFLQDQNAKPDQIVRSLGRTGMALVYDSQSEGPTVGFRCDLDALPIQEKGNNRPYLSKYDGIAHLCGHDGHMTMVTALGLIFGRQRPTKGKVVLLYQPAEETGKGAAWIVQDPKFKKLNLDYLFGLHNIPGIPKGTIVLKEGHFNAASKGMEIQLKGSTSHAAEPEKGVSPAGALAELMTQLQTIVKPGEYKEFTLLTIVHAILGDKAYGISPGYAELHATLRAYRDMDLGLLAKRIESLVNRVTYRNKLRYAFRYSEEFPAVKNDPEPYEEMLKAAEAIGQPIKIREKPYNWSEDFGHYRRVTKTGFFGLGSGEGQPELHHEDYDFPDDIMPAGVSMYYQLATNLLG